MSINVKPVQKYIASDGSEHANRKSALAQEKYIIRKQRLEAMWNAMRMSADIEQCVDRVAIISFIASNGDSLADAMRVVETRKKAAA